MNMHIYPELGMVSYPAEFVYCRWGAGAAPGRTHVFSTIHSAGWWALGATTSWQCVTDDFGRLVAVAS